MDSLARPVRFGVSPLWSCPERSSTSLAFSTPDPAELWARLSLACHRSLQEGAAFVLIARRMESLADPKWLSARDADALARMRNPRRRTSFVLGRTLVAELLTRGSAAPWAPVEIDALGKPAVRDGPGISLSHAEDFVACAMCASTAVGVDVELLSRIASPGRLVPLVAHDAEIDLLHACGPGDLAALFRRCWTRKEAALKAAGVGLRYDPRRIDVLSSDFVRPMGRTGLLRLLDLFPASAELGGAVATPAAVIDVVGCSLEAAPCG